MSAKLQALVMGGMCDPSVAAKLMDDWKAYDAAAYEKAIKDFFSEEAGARERVARHAGAEAVISAMHDYIATTRNNIIIDPEGPSEDVMQAINKAVNEE
jgi:hypothetical protein